MTNKEIKFKTIMLINGISYLPNSYLENFKHYVCYTINLPKTEETFKVIEDAVALYFKMQNSISIVYNKNE